MKRLLRRKGASLLFLLALGGIWEAVSRLGLVSPLYFPPASDILAAWSRLMVEWVLPPAVWETFLRMACGYLLAAALMIPFGMALGLSRTLYNLFEPTIEMLRPLPPPAVIPPAMLFLGIGPAMKVFVIFFACAFPILLNTMDGARAVPRLLRDTGRTLGAGPLRRLWAIVLPAALPGVMSGLRVALPMALIVAVLSEMIGSVDGIGHFILQMQRTFNIVEMYAGIVTLGLFGWLQSVVFTAADKALLSWNEGWKKGRG